MVVSSHTVFRLAVPNEDLYQQKLVLKRVRTLQEDSIEDEPKVSITFDEQTRKEIGNQSNKSASL